MYHLDLEGRQLYEKINFREERADLIENPLLGPMLRRKDQMMKDDLMFKRANKLAIYYLNLHKRYDLNVTTIFSIIIYLSVELPAVPSSDFN